MSNFFCDVCDRALWTSVPFVCGGCGGPATPFGKASREKFSEKKMKTLKELIADIQSLGCELSTIQGKIYDARMHLAHALAHDCVVEFDDTHRLQDFWGVKEGDILKRVQHGGKWDGLVSIWYVKKVQIEGHAILAQLYKSDPDSASWTQEFASFDAGHFFAEAEVTSGT